MSVVKAVAGILDVYLYALPPIGGSGADESLVLGPLDLRNDPQAFSCFLYNAIYANFPAELCNTVAALRSVLNGVTDLPVPGYKVLSCNIS